MPSLAIAPGALLATADLGPIRMARLRCRGATARGEGTSEARAYSFILLESGGGVLAQGGHRAILAPGDLVLCDAAAPFELTLAEGAEILTLAIEAALLREYLPSPEAFCGRRLAAGEGLTSTVAAMATGLFAQLEAGLALHYEARVAQHLLDMLATSFAIAFEAIAAGPSIAGGRHATVKLYIEQHLRDPGLSPCSIAQRLKLSPRYVRMIFATGNETVSAYILRRRLEECARQIADPSWRGHSMTEIAFAWGFNSAPHFTRSFRGRYAMSPRDYRRLKLAEGEGPFRRSLRVPAAPAARAA